MTTAALGPRPYQVVVWGASGFTGKLVCQHIAEHYQGDLTWAIAGRSQKKLEAVRQELTAINPACKSVPILVGDLDDQASIDEVVRQTAVVVATAGPYACIGTPVVEASARLGSHYCDITGEPLWIKRMMQRYHSLAEQTGAKIVHCCGYDSIPADLGTTLVVDHIKTQLGKKTSKVVEMCGPFLGKAGGSGGTIATVFEMGRERLEDTKACAADPLYLVDPPGPRSGDDKPDNWTFGFNQATGRHYAPHLFQVCDRRIVHRSNALLGNAYGDGFSYEEFAEAGGPLSAVAATLGAGLVGLLLAAKPLHGILRRLLPKPGEGPSPEAQRTSSWHHTVIGYTQEEAGVKPQTVVADIGDAHRDRGYWGTSRMVLETAICLATQGEELKAAGYKQGGILTPGSAAGVVLIQRLRDAGMTFQIRS